MPGKHSVVEENSDQKEVHSAYVELQYVFENPEILRALCGVADEGVGRLERILDVRIIPRGHSFIIQAEEGDKAVLAERFFQRLISRLEDNPGYFPELSQPEELFRRLKEELLEIQENGNQDYFAHLQEGQDPLREKIFTTHRGKSIFPRTIRQAAYVHSILENPVTFCRGPAGTGKTFLAIAAACRLLQNKKIDRIILTRPAVEAGESLGFLPGDMSQKVDPYLRPVYDALYECLGPDKVNDLIQSQRIEIAPLAFMRGRTLNHSVIILDEAQNCTIAQLKMVLTRLGANAHMCVGGDVTQSDLSPGKSGLIWTIELLGHLEDVGVIEFTRQDIIRNPLVERIVAAFERFEEH